MIQHVSDDPLFISSWADGFIAHPFLQDSLTAAPAGWLRSGGWERKGEGTRVGVGGQVDYAADLLQGWLNWNSPAAPSPNQCPSNGM